MRKTYRYRLYPTKAQVTLLEKTLGGMPMSL
ncbi:MAG TPA: helix-turn-helix domain-containing protein [Candidatus Methanoculleus thermohydrogenotrophicum]|nr:helix-turn-helix domain-containing protein [Candidatus Methanoculleus thermohydrogenotrophicum]